MTPTPRSFFFDNFFGTLWIVAIVSPGYMPRSRRRESFGRKGAWATLGCKKFREGGYISEPGVAIRIRGILKP